MQNIQTKLFDGGLDKTIELMRSIILKDSMKSNVRMFALKLVEDLDGRDFDGIANRIFRWLQTNIKYTRDPYTNELLHDFEALLKTRNGDCDDFTIAGSTLLNVLGVPVRIKVAAYSLNPATKKPNFSHVYLEYFSERFTSWIPFDASQKEFSVGQEGKDLIASLKIDINQGIIKMNDIGMSYEKRVRRDLAHDSLLMDIIDPQIKLSARSKYSETEPMRYLLNEDIVMLNGMNDLNGFFSRLWRGVKKAAGTVWKGVKAVGTFVAKNPVLAAVITGGIGLVAGGVIQGVVSKITGGAEQATEVANTATQTIEQLKSGDVVGLAARAVSNNVVAQTITETKNSLQERLNIFPELAGKQGESLALAISEVKEKYKDNSRFAELTKSYSLAQLTDNQVKKEQTLQQSTNNNQTVTQATNTAQTVTQAGMSPANMFIVGGIAITVIMMLVKSKK